MRSAVTHPGDLAPPAAPSTRADLAAGEDRGLSEGYPALSVAPALCGTPRLRTFASGADLREPPNTATRSGDVWIVGLALFVAHLLVVGGLALSSSCTRPAHLALTGPAAADRWTERGLRRSRHPPQERGAPRAGPQGGNP